MKILHIDIETAPNTAHVWAMFKQNIAINQIQESSYTMCWAAKWHGVKKIHFSSVHQTTPLEMLKEIHALLCEADAVVHYNGAKFDIPTLNKEFLLEGLEPPTPYHQIDLLRVARSKFRFASNKLDYVAQALGVGKKVKHIGHELWVQCMAGLPKAWKQMETYNKQDVALLEEVYLKLRPWITNHPNHALYVDEVRPQCPNCGETKLTKNGTDKLATGIYQRFRCSRCKVNIRERNNLLEKQKRRALLTQSKI